MKRILCMSESRKDIANKIESGVPELILHLIKLRRYPDSQDVNKWRQEVAEKLYRISTLKNTHKFPDPDFILKHTWGVYESQLPYYYYMIVRDYGESVVDTNVPSLYDDIHDYFIWLADMLSQHGRVAFQDVYERLRELNF